MVGYLKSAGGLDSTELIYPTDHNLPFEMIPLKLKVDKNTGC